MANNKGRSGRPYRRLRAELKAQGLPCWLCGQLIDYDLPYPDPWSFSVDHVRPVSKGGASVDPDNCRPAHLQCNQRKGDRSRPVVKAVVFSTSEAW
ncbi:HNH endonuclease signature motif containing protein [Saccharopolyspora sp. WRP15-2]|uniref:HNH endonuclease signature motif containing protein n=1 Tax=Saccharopolyspora oryzae TaxID=2997343 RepID=A0ABT4URC3_9PSEU|nr:HNH endonuclease signature motif containing protein [Saccharopolyspora oryzae]MDA3624268.1 HNH endonuclease signature motif containing protein [Saccharopolyspora oryzae]